jgi:predicted DNA-binding ArsR family transcriptional regulator
MYHVNPTTGNAGVCRAGSPDGCPFGTPAEHHENANDARAAFEARMSGETLQVHKKLYKPREDDGQESRKNPSKVFNEIINKIEPKRAKFEKADRKYREVYDLMYNDEYAALPSFNDEDLRKFRDERDKFAKEIGVPTIVEQEEAIKENDRRDRVTKAKKLALLRHKITDQSVGRETNRGRLNNLERDLLKMHEWHGVDGGEGEIPPKEVWELKRSTSQYQVDLSSKELKDLGVVSFVSSRDKKDRAELLKKSIASASISLEEAEKALASS